MFRKNIPAGLLRKSLLLPALLLLAAYAAAQQPPPGFGIRVLARNMHTSLRGMSVVSDSVVWVSGSNGTVGRTTDGGESWQWIRVPGYEKNDFRDIEAFGSREAVVMSIASPAFILRTEDGGATWREVYVNRADSIFLDGMAFFDERRGLAYGDPMQGRFFVLRTHDGGRHWKPLPLKNRPPAAPGEASFAASGTAIAALEDGHAWIATGGSRSGVFSSTRYGKKWKHYPCPLILQGAGSTGIFSLAFFDDRRGIAVGGDYTADTVRLNNACLTNDGGKTWQRPIINPFGYRSCVAYLTERMVVATGSSGTDISLDGGVTWRHISDASFSVAGKARHGAAVFLAGPGITARFCYPGSPGRQEFGRNAQSSIFAAH